MVGIDLKGKNAIVTGVSDDGGFGWAIAKALQAAGANVHLACHPRVVNIVSMFMRRPGTAESRKLPYGVEGELKPASIIACDVQYDTLADIPEDVRSTKAYEGDASVRGMIEKYKELTGSAPIDILVHSVAFSPEIQKTHLETSRGAYLTAASVGAYSLIALVREALPLMDGRGASVVGITYAASERVVPGYGGGMASAKAALENDVRYLAHFAGKHGVRVNAVSPGPFPSRAARSIGDIQSMLDAVAAKSPLGRSITAENVADTVLFLSSSMAAAITGENIHIDSGHHVMG
jgi:enoyl-[acyl-carrier protein] reductase I